MTICFSAPVRSTELMGGKGPSNRISTTLPRTDATTPRLDEVVLVSMIFFCLCLFHFGSVFATARSAVASGAMKQSLLRCFDIGFFAQPNLQSRLLDGASKRKRQRPRQSRLESNIHGVQTGGGRRIIKTA